MNVAPETTLSLGDFKPSDEWQTHINEIFYGLKGPGIHNHFQTFVSQDHRLAHTLAEEYYRNVRAFDAGEKNRFVFEWGVGNGNLAGCFLTHLKNIDQEGKVYPRIRYVLCDYSLEILNGVRKNSRLQEHQGRFYTVQIDASHMDCFKSGCADKIVSNEIWDDLATKVLLKHEGMLFEEYIQPRIGPGEIPDNFEEFQHHFLEKNLTELKKFPSFIQAILWDKTYQRVDINEWPCSEHIQAQVERLSDEIPIPVNIGALATLGRAKQILSPCSQGYTSMDYGMYGFNDLNQQGRPYFNLYGGQYTFMVNFELLESSGKNFGFNSVLKEYQHSYVGSWLKDKVVSAVEIAQGQPDITHMQPGERDILMIQILLALNHNYKGPYKNKLEYPVMEGTPKKQRKQIAKLSKNLNPHGVPDTVAYVTQSEVFSVLPQLKQLGYREKDLQGFFNAPPPPISFICLSFR